MDYLPEGSAIALVDPERAVTRAITLLRDEPRVPRGGLERGDRRARPARSTSASGDFVSLPALREAAGQRGIAWWTLSAFDSGEADASAEGLLEVAAGAAVRVPGTSVPSFQGNVDGATAHVGELLADGWRVVVAASGAGLVERARDVLAERGIAARRVDDVLEPPEPGVAHVVLSHARARLRGRRTRSSRCSPRPSSTAARSAATSGWSRSSRRVAGTSSTRCS